MAIRTANNKSMSAITELPSGVSAKSLILLATETASSSDLVTFASNIDSTYKEYQIHVIQAHCETDNQILQMGFRDGGSAYDATKTTTYFNAMHKEDDTSTSLGYNTDQDQAQATGFLNISEALGADNDQCANIIIHLYDPSSTTFVKHFSIRTAYVHQNDRSIDAFISGYCNTTSAIDGVQFKMDTDAIDAGTFKLYGVV
jgi:hypothetical protein